MAEFVNGDETVVVLVLLVCDCAREQPINPRAATAADKATEPIEFTIFMRQNSIRSLVVMDLLRPLRINQDGHRAIVRKRNLHVGAKFARVNRFSEILC